MSVKSETALLPAGLRDVLPPEAGHEAAVVDALVARFARHGYQRVRPPLVEFEDSLLAEAGAATATQTFRLMDPVSQRMMGVRTDMTVQVARIAATRLARAPRPLRLCYAGQVLRVRGTQLEPLRELRQVGAELIGAGTAAADAEVVALAAGALDAAGVLRLSVDLNLPRLVPALAAGLRIADPAGLRHALDHKDAARVRALAGAEARVFAALLDAAGPAETALPALAALSLQGTAGEEVGYLAEVVGRIREAAPNLVLTVDPVEHRGFEYHTGVSFSLFAGGVRGELGRGGRYVAGDTEAATGFTLAMETVMTAVPPPAPERRLYVAFGTAQAEAERARAEGWAAVSALGPVADMRAEAKRLGCGHVLSGGRIVEVG